MSLPPAYDDGAIVAAPKGAPALSAAAPIAAAPIGLPAVAPAYGVPQMAAQPPIVCQPQMLAPPPAAPQNVTYCSSCYSIPLSSVLLACDYHVVYLLIKRIFGM